MSYYIAANKEGKICLYKGYPLKRKFSIYREEDWGDTDFYGKDVMRKIDTGKTYTDWNIKGEELNEEFIPEKCKHLTFEDKPIKITMI